MKYCVLIMDGAAGLPLADRGGQTCLELARTPNLDKLAAAGFAGLARTVPPGMEPSSACACMSVMGYNPQIYYKGRATIEAVSMGIDVGAGEVVFRCNLVALKDGNMHDYSAGHITTEEARRIIESLNESLGSQDIIFFPGVSYRHILKIRGREDTLQARCTPPHDIPGKPVSGYLPQGAGSDLLLDLMKRSEAVLKDHSVNKERLARGESPATSIWLFWGSGRVPDMPAFQKEYGLKAALTSGVDLLKGLAQMASMTVLDINGVTDGLDNNFTGQVDGALEALASHDLAVIHVEAPDEAGHGGSSREKIEAIERIDADIVGRLLKWGKLPLRVLVMPDHPTPVAVRTHTAEAVPFLLWGEGIERNGVTRFTEAESRKTGVLYEEGYKIMSKLVEI